MCGLVGALAFADEDPAALLADVRALMPRMAWRGPDDEGSWGDDRCALGFKRLAILDLTQAGHQPMRSADGRYAMVYNGEIYNFAALRDELGYAPRSSGDAEVLLHALATWGPDALAKLDGMFAVALYDTRERTLLLARDHVGIKPLHFAHTARGVVFGSQHDQVLAHPWVRTPPSRDGLALYLRLGFVPAPFGLHGQTAQLEAGAWRRFGPGGATQAGRYFALPRVAPATLRGGDALDAFEAAFTRSVKRQLVSDVPVGLFLSGGIDSPLVAAEVARQGAALRAYSIGVADAAMDESDDARRYAEALGLAQTIERLDDRAALALLDDVVAASTEPTADFSMFPTLAVSRLARRGATVALSGDGGDELYWGYPSRFASAIEQARYFAWPRPARAAAVAARRAGMGKATRDVLRFDSIGRLYQRKHTLMAEADLAALFPTLPALPATFDAFDCEATDADEVAQWTRWNELRIHLARVLAKVDRASMFCSLEVRVPLLGKEVVETAWRTDWRSCLDLETRTGKRPLREALRRRVAFQSGAKRGFTVPMHAWLRGPLRDRVQALLLDRDALLGLPYDRAALRALDARLLAGDDSVAWGMWLLLSAALWEQRHA